VLTNNTGVTMPLYFLLGTLTETGQKMLLRNPDLMLETIRQTRCEGAQILGQYAVLGKYDYVMLAEANDNEAVGRLALEIGVKAGLHTETLPAMAIGDLADEEPDQGYRGAEAAEAPSSEEWRLPSGGS
jgi:uncharacterized protein with GYD domain